MADYDVRGLDKARPGVTPEKSDDGIRPAGLYRHPVSGAELIVQNDPLFGDGQARAAERVGFVFVRPAEEGEIKTVLDASIDKENQPKADGANADDLKGLLARVNALEAENAKLKNQNESGVEVPGTEAVVSADEAKEAATQKVEEQTGTKVDVNTGDVAKEAAEETQSSKKGK